VLLDEMLQSIDLESLIFAVVLLDVFARRGALIGHRLLDAVGLGDRVLDPRGVLPPNRSQLCRISRSFSKTQSPSGMGVPSFVLAHHDVSAIADVVVRSAIRDGVEHTARSSTPRGGEAASVVAGAR
jgi:hypothetical protein